MVETRHSSFASRPDRRADFTSTRWARPIDFTPASPDLPFECFTLGELRERVGRAELEELQQLRFDLVIAPTAGRGVHEVDFVRTSVGPNEWLHIRPGQVHRSIEGAYRADLILFAELTRTPHWQSGPRIIALDDDQLHDIRPLLDLARHRRRTDVGTATLQTLRDLLVRWLGLDRPDASDRDPLYASFRRLLDKDVIHSRNVEEYAARLGCSARTLARACERAGAYAPKKLIDEAVVLEAQRLLALPGATVTDTARTLGFDEVTNFTKFFKRVAGGTPSRWQSEQHGDQPG